MDTPTPPWPTARLTFRRTDFLRVYGLGGGKTGCILFVDSHAVAYLPEEDINRNLTGLGYSGSALASVNRYDASFPAAYQGKIRVDDIGRGYTAGVDDSISPA